MSSLFTPFLIETPKTCNTFSSLNLLCRLLRKSYSRTYTQLKKVAFSTFRLQVYFLHWSWNSNQVSFVRRILSCEYGSLVALFFVSPRLIRSGQFLSGSIVRIGGRFGHISGLSCEDLEWMNNNARRTMKPPHYVMNTNRIWKKYKNTLQTGMTNHLQASWAVSYCLGNKMKWL